MLRCLVLLAAPLSAAAQRVCFVTHEGDTEVSEEGVGRMLGLRCAAGEPPVHRTIGEPIRDGFVTRLRDRRRRILREAADRIVRTCAGPGAAGTPGDAAPGNSASGNSASGNADR